MEEVEFKVGFIGPTGRGKKRAILDRRGIEDKKRKMSGIFIKQWVGQPASPGVWRENVQKGS